MSSLFPYKPPAAKPAHKTSFQLAKEAADAAATKASKKTKTTKSE
tara:strand:+ start:402 stop:536 length:135 start_codon:yes stop_codon:yes gene_type:complete